MPTLTLHAKMMNKLIVSVWFPPEFALSLVGLGATVGYGIDVVEGEKGKFVDEVYVFSGVCAIWVVVDDEGGNDEFGFDTETVELKLAIFVADKTLFQSAENWIS